MNASDTRLRPRRSALFMPGSNDRALTKARSLRADCIIIDLEDAVSPDDKQLARDTAVSHLREGGFGNRERYDPDRNGRRARFTGVEGFLRCEPEFI